MGDVQARTRGTLIPFPPPALRPPRRSPQADEPRGEILLFTGVRYERQIEPSPEPSAPLLSDGQPRRRRRRS